MSLKDRINEDMKTAMRAKDAPRGPRAQPEHQGPRWDATAGFVVFRVLSLIICHFLTEGRP